MVSLEKSAKSVKTAPVKNAEAHQQLIGGNPSWRANWPLADQNLIGEILDRETRDVWIGQEPFTWDEYEAMTPPEGFWKVGIGRAAYDLAYFHRSPGEVTDGPVEVMVIGDRSFSRVKRTVSIDGEFAGGMVVTTAKHLSVLFLAGRRLDLLVLDDGRSFVPQASEARTRGPWTAMPVTERVLPEGSSLKELVLEEDLVLELPSRSTHISFTNGDVFHGPIVLQS